MTSHNDRFASAVYAGFRGPYVGQSMSSMVIAMQTRGIPVASKLSLKPFHDVPSMGKNDRQFGFRLYETETNVGS